MCGLESQRNGEGRYGVRAGELIARRGKECAVGIDRIVRSAVELECTLGVGRGDEGEAVGR